MSTTFGTLPLAADAMLTALRNAGLAAHYDRCEETVLAYPLGTERARIEEIGHVRVISPAFDPAWPFGWAGFQAYGWAPGAYGPQQVKQLHDTPLDHREVPSEEAAVCAAKAAEWLTAVAGGTPPVTALIDALTNAGVGAFWEAEEGMLIAHPRSTSRDDALKGEHVMVEWSGAVPNTPAEERATLEATVWVPDGPRDFAQIATAYNSPDGRPLGEEAAQCARAVAEWFAEPRPTAGKVLLAALAEYGITTYDELLGMSYGIPVDQDTGLMHIRNGFHLSVGDRAPMVEHVPAAHTGWTVFVHDDQGEPIGDPLHISGDGELVDCAQDSAATAAVIAEFITAPLSRHCDCYSQERYGRNHDHECNRYRRPERAA